MTDPTPREAAERVLELEPATSPVPCSEYEQVEIMELAPILARAVMRLEGELNSARGRNLGSLATIEELQTRVAEFEQRNSFLQTELRSANAREAEVRKERDDSRARVTELKDRHGVAPMAVACGLEPAATLDELYERMRSLVASEWRVTQLGFELCRGIPSEAVTSSMPPKDGRSYRVWTRSHVVRWEAGPNRWVAGVEHCTGDLDDGEDWDWHANNLDGWAPEPDQSGEGES